MYMIDQATAGVITCQIKYILSLCCWCVTFHLPTRALQQLQGLLFDKYKCALWMQCRLAQANRGSCSSCWEV